MIDNYILLENLSENINITFNKPTSEVLNNYKQYKIIANILQPIVENILEHTNIKTMRDGEINLTITDFGNNKSLLEITDNAISITENDIRFKSEGKNTGISLQLLNEIINGVDTNLIKYVCPNYKNNNEKFSSKFYLYS